MGPNAGKYVQEVVERGMQTDMMTRFENAFAEALGVKHCIAMPGCTPALHGLFLATDFQPGDEIIVSPITDYGTVQGLLAQNLIPIFADTPPGAINISAETIAACITPRTKAVLVVHYTGIICDMDAINAVASHHGIKVYEDCCQAVFGQYKGRYAGTLGDAACFSFDPEKTMGSDTGGCFVTNDTALYERARYVAQYRAGTAKEGFGRVHTDVGYAYRMPHCTAAIGLAQLEVVRDWVAQRDKIGRLFYTYLAEVPGITPLALPDTLDVFSCWMLGFRINEGAFRCTADAFGAKVQAKGLPTASTARYYLMAEALEILHKKTAGAIFPYSSPPAETKYVYNAGTCPNAHAFMETFIRSVDLSEKWQPEHAALAATWIAEVAEECRA
jgi:dTDP-4-amino-4,6-dideoxygalactose transaminase